MTTVKELAEEYKVESHEKLLREIKEAVGKQYDNMMDLHARYLRVRDLYHEMVDTPVDEFKKKYGYEWR